MRHVHDRRRALVERRVRGRRRTLGEPRRRGRLPARRAAAAAGSTASARARLTRCASPPESESALRFGEARDAQALERSVGRGALPRRPVDPSPAQRQLDVANHARREQPRPLGRVADAAPKLQSAPAIGTPSTSTVPDVGPRAPRAAGAGSSCLRRLGPAPRAARPRPGRARRSRARLARHGGGERPAGLRTAPTKRRAAGPT